MKDGNNLGGKNKYIWKIAVAVLLVVAMVCVGVACARKAKEDAAQDTFEQLAERTSKVPLEHRSLLRKVYSLRRSRWQRARIRQIFWES